MSSPQRYPDHRAESGAALAAVAAVAAAGSSRPDRRATLAALAPRVEPVALAGDRILPTDPELAELFAEGGLVRGRVLACTGTAATSLALALVAPGVAAGGWLALVDVPWVGLDAASELGVALERVVAVRTAGAAWADAVAAVADGCDLILARVPRRVPAPAARALLARLRQRGVVLIVLGDPGALGADGELATTIEAWEGIGDGHGYLRQRRVAVHASGRRLRGRTVRVDLAGQRRSRELRELHANGPSRMIAVAARAG